MLPLERTGEYDLKQSANYEDRMVRVLDYISQNLDGDLSLDTLADVAAMSRFHWHRVFHAITGYTLAETVRRVRMYRAACWLVQTDLPITRIATDSGYDNLRSFSRVFSEHFGTSPVAFRKNGAVEALTSSQREGHHKMYDIEVTKAPERRLVGLPHKGPYLEIGSKFEKLTAVISARNLWPHAQGMVGVYYDDPSAVEPDDLQSYAGIAVTSDLTVPEGLEEVTLPEGEVAVLHYKGPYSGLHKAYGHLYGSWLPDSGREFADRPAFEVYKNSPADTKPENLLTDICVPLK